MRIRGVLLVAVVVLGLAGTAPPVNAATGSWEIGDSSVEMVDAVANGGWSTQLACSPKPDQASRLLICRTSCAAGGTTCPGTCNPLDPTELVEAQFPTPGPAGSLAAPHRFAFVATGLPGEPIECLIGTVPKASILPAAAVARVDQDLQPLCLRLRCVGGSSAGSSCSLDADCAGAGECSGVCEGGVNEWQTCNEEADCPGGFCIPPLKYCDGGTNNGEACVGDSGCGGGTCTANGFDCTVQGTHAAPPRFSTVPALGVWSIVLAGAILLFGVWLVQRRFA